LHPASWQQELQVRTEFMALPAPRLPDHRTATATLSLALAAALHAAAGFVLSILPVRAQEPFIDEPNAARSVAVEIRHIAFIARNPGGGGGGGGGGNRETGPIRRAEGKGTDSITLRARKPVADTLISNRPISVETPMPSVVLDARPMASGDDDQIGLPEGGVTFGTSTGPGSGGGLGDGEGTGIGRGRGPGIGEGSGGGIGGGVYRPGSGIAPPRVVREVKPTYTHRALLEKIQGTVLLEVIVTEAGRTTGIRVIRSLDPDGLDREAVLAASQWEFEPGRLAGKPVRVVVTIALDFAIR
jgi:TonB family protein